MKRLILAISSEIISYISLGVATFSLIISYLKFKQTISDEVKKKQVDLVFELIAVLQKTHFTLFYVIDVEEKLTEVDFALNIFQIVTIGMPEENERLFIPIDKGEIIFLEEFTHPMLPDKISKQWKNFLGEIRIRTFHDFKNPPDQYCCLYEKISLRSPNITCFELMGGTDKFYKGAEGMRKTILKWLKKQNITDINQDALRKLAPRK